MTTTGAPIIHDQAEAARVYLWNSWRPGYRSRPKVLPSAWTVVGRSSRYSDLIDVHPVLKGVAD